jgi:hypothetical protein
VATQAGVLAMGGAIGDWCNDWDAEYEGECWIGGGFPPGWSANGNIDLSEEEEPELIGAALCNGLWDACEEDCSTPYKEYVADWASSTMSESDPCYSAATDPACYETWGNGSCDAGPITTWSCSCQSFMFCEC